MKKYLCTVLAALLALVSLVGCGGSASAPEYNSAKDGEWFEIQSILCSKVGGVDSNDTPVSSLVSTYVVNTDGEEITEEEYEAAPQEQKQLPDAIRYNHKEAEFDTNREKTLSELQNSVGKTYCKKYYYPSYREEYYEKFTVKSYKTRYVRVRFLNSDTIEVNFFKTTEDEKDIYVTTRVKATSYTIIYFND